MADFLLFLPETTVLASAFILFALSIIGVKYKTAFLASVLFAAAAFAASIAGIGASGQPFYPGIYTVDAFSQLLKVGLTGGLLLVTLTAADLTTVRPFVRLDVPFFLFVSTAGMMMLVSATELLTLYVALELSAYGLYILVALHRAQREGTEAGLKYLIFGGTTSTITLFGLSLIFGSVGTTHLSDIYAYAAASPQPVFYVGVLLAMSGFFFKLAVFPFHSWAPDAYQASPHQVTTFLGTVSKVAAIGVLVRAATFTVQTPDVLFTIFFILATLSMTFGNLAAIGQSDIKRLLAYSTVAQAGYMLVGLTVFTETGMASALFYGLTYVLMSFLPFLVVTVLGRDGSNPTLDSLRGLHKRSPLLALALLVGVFGLAGIPPTPGFAGKWFLFSAALEKGQFALVLIAAVNATIALYYYLQIVRAAYLGDSDDDSPIRISGLTRVVAVVTVLITTVIGILPSFIWDLATDAARVVLP